MKTQERRAAILQKIQLYDEVLLQDLVTQLASSESTIRRDLASLEAEGLVIRIHGGAKRAYTLDLEPSFVEKAGQRGPEKLLIGQLACEQIQAQSTIFLDAGTTTLQMVPYLKELQVKVVTNGLQQASYLADAGIETILLGGRLKRGTRAIVGHAALEQLSNYRFNGAFLGINGLDVTFGYTTPDQEEAAIKALAMRQASKAYVLADSSKFSKVSFCRVASIEDAIIVTDGRLGKGLEAYAGLTKLIQPDFIQ